MNVEEKGDFNSGVLPHRFANFGGSEGYSSPLCATQPRGNIQNGIIN